VNPEINPISALPRAMDQSGFQEEPASQAEPRFDRSLPLRDRIDLGELAGDELVRKWAKGWDISLLRDQFCDWMALHDAPRNAQTAFFGWLQKTAGKRASPTPAAQERRLDPTSLAAQWKAEDALDAQLKAPVWPAERVSSLPRALSRLAASVVSRVAAQGVHA
jgi:hypothetical protein